MKILVLNCGSSSIKFELFDMNYEEPIIRGLLDRIGTQYTVISYEFKKKGRARDIKQVRYIKDHKEGIQLIIDILLDKSSRIVNNKGEIEAVGHRVVHGGEKFEESALINTDVKNEIKRCFELAPLHNPHNLRGILACERILPKSKQVAVFDTAFHQRMPPRAFFYALPYRLYKKYGIRRYGFHGISHFYVLTRLSKIFKKPQSKIKVLSCHLGNGASIAAISGGRSKDTSMGFTPLEGLVMGTRCGDIDPYIPIYLMTKEELTLNAISSILNNQSGLYGLSGVSNDMREIVRHAKKFKGRAKLAIEVFAYRVKKYIGAYLAILNGVDAIAFTGGIGEHSHLVRKIILEGLDNLGIKIDLKKNRNILGKEGLISNKESKIKIYVVPTNEELIIARETERVLLHSRSLQKRAR